MIAEQTVALSPADVEGIRRVIDGLEKAWNSADGEDYGLWFQEDAEFVNVYGMYAQGRRQIAEGHNLIFITVYAGSTLRLIPLNVRLITAEVAVAHLQARLSVPRGPMAGEHDSLPAMTLVRDCGAWKIAAFHNTFVQRPHARSAHIVLRRVVHTGLGSERLRGALKIKPHHHRVRFGRFVRRDAGQ